MRQHRGRLLGELLGGRQERGRPGSASRTTPGSPPRRRARRAATGSPDYPPAEQGGTGRVTPVDSVCRRGMGAEAARLGALSWAPGDPRVPRPHGGVWRRRRRSRSGELQAVLGQGLLDDAQCLGAHPVELGQLPARSRARYRRGSAGDHPATWLARRPADRAGPGMGVGGGDEQGQRGDDRTGTAVGTTFNVRACWSTGIAERSGRRIAARGEVSGHVESCPAAEEARQAPHMVAGSEGPVPGLQRGGRAAAPRRATGRPGVEPAHARQSGYRAGRPPRGSWDACSVTPGTPAAQRRGSRR